MALSIVGTPANIASGGSYTPEAGSNRLVVLVAVAKNTPSVTLTNISYNGNTRTPTIQQTDSAGGDRDTAAICVFKESELPAGSTVATATWSATPTVSRIICFTVQDADQSTTVRGSNGNYNIGNTVTTTQTVTVGDLLIGGLAHRGAAGTNTLAFNGSWTESYDADNGDGGQFGAGYHVATGTSDGLDVTVTGASDDWAAASIAIIAASGGGGGNSIAWIRA